MVAFKDSLTLDIIGYRHGRRKGRGPDFENVSKKGYFKSFEREKSNFTTFAPLEKLWKNFLVALWKISFRRPWLSLKFMIFICDRNSNTCYNEFAKNKTKS